MITTVAACKDPVSLTLTRRLAVRQLPFRRGITAALTRLVHIGELTDELATVLNGSFGDADDDLARLAGRALAHLPSGHDELACRLLSAACRTRTFYPGSLPGGHRGRALLR